MNETPEFKTYLTTDEIDIEINKVKDFFNRIPDELKAVAAERFIFEIVTWGCQNHYEALGIFQEAMNRYREVSLEIGIEMIQKEEYENAHDSIRGYLCIKELTIEGREFGLGEVCSIGFAGEDSDYTGGKKYFLFDEDEEYFSICQGILDEYFELIDE